MSPLLRGVDSGEAVCVREGAVGVGDISLPSAQFYCDPKATLKNKVFLKTPEGFRDGRKVI